MKATEKLLVQLLKIESYSGQETNLANFILKKLPKFAVKKQFVSKNCFNIIAKKGKSDVWLVCHMDTVKGEVSLKASPDRIQGRGACDNKGNLAGLIIAANQLTDINILLTVSEEYDFAGVKKAAPVIKGDKFIILEPTDFKVITEQRGVITGTINAKGKEAHSSLGAKNSAIHSLVDKLNALRRKNWPLFNIGIIEGGLAENIVAPKASAIFSARPKTIIEFNSILKDLKKAGVVVKNRIPPFRSNLQNKIKQTGSAPFFSEMAFFKNSVLFGAGEIEQMHSENEFILKKDLNRLPAKLIELVKNVDKIKI